MTEDGGRVARRAARPRPVRELLILGLGVVAFERVHASVGRDASVATANAQRLQALERALHLDVELGANAWLAARPVASILAVAVYRLYYVAVVGVLVWAWWRHPDTYVRARRALLAMAVVALLVYAALPVSPPRFALPGIVDVVARHDLLGGAGHGAGSPGSYSAMPSLHVGWAAWCAFTVWSALSTSRPRPALGAWLFPALMALVVIGTGNHYLLDLVGSAVLLAVGVLAATLSAETLSRAGRIGRRRPAGTGLP